MIKYSVFDKQLNLVDLSLLADSIKTCFLETGNLLMDNDNFISWNRLEELRSHLIERQKIIICMDTGKPYYDLEYHKDFFRRGVLLGVKYIRPVVDESIVKPVGTAYMTELCKYAKAYNMGVLLENTSRLSDVIDSMDDLYKIPVGDRPGFIFNPLEYVKSKRHPFFHKFYNSRLKNHIRILRVNDALFKTGKPVLPGTGNAEIKEMASILLSRSFDGWFSIEKYIQKKNETEVLEKFKYLLKSM